MRHPLTRLARTCLFALAALVVLAAAAPPAPAAAQSTWIRTAPFLHADSVRLLPAAHAGMGGVSIALPDSLGDPGSNPAAWARLRRDRLFGTPQLYTVSENAGNGWSLPLGGFARSGPWFAAGALAVQSVDPVRPLGATFAGPVDGIPEEEAPRGSRYLLAAAGRTWPERGLSVGVGVSAGTRGAVDGAGLLFERSAHVASSGRSADVRLGLLWEAEGGGTLDASVHGSRSRMRHDVTYADLYWDPDAQATLRRPREAPSRDDADVLGARLVLTRPLAPGWRAGALLSGESIDLPSLPRYDTPSDGVMNLASARGNARAWNVGAGLATDDHPRLPFRLGVDVVWEPVHGRTWSESEAGEPTLENRLRFSNAITRVGGSHAWPLDGAGSELELQLGLATRVVRYRLLQRDLLHDAERREASGWIEWTPTWGAAFRLREVELRYAAGVTTGTKRAVRPRTTSCCFPVGGAARLTTLPGGPGFPTAPGTLERVSLLRQQLSISLPVGPAGGRGGVR